MNSAVDLPALLLGACIAGVITAVLGILGRGESGKRAWIIAGALAVCLIALGLIDLLRETPRETHVAVIFFGVGLPVLGAMGAIHGTRRIRSRLRWPTVFLVTFALLFAGLLLGAALLPRFLPF